MRFIILLLLLSITIEQGIFLSKYYFEDYYKYEKCDKLEINIPFQILVPPLFIILLILLLILLLVIIFIEPDMR